MAALFGGLLVSWGYGGISPAAFLRRCCKDAIGVNTFLVGLIKAPFMALVIGLIATHGRAGDGGLRRIAGAAGDRLGREKSIFMVIVLDGLFAMFFAAIHY